MSTAIHTLLKAIRSQYPDQNAINEKIKTHGDSKGTIILIPHDGAPIMIPTNLRFVGSTATDTVSYKGKVYTFSAAASIALGGPSTVYHEVHVTDITDADFLPPAPEEPVIAEDGKTD